jgi:hypothetical protein
MIFISICKIEVSYRIFYIEKVILYTKTMQNNK